MKRVFILAIVLLSLNMAHSQQPEFLGIAVGTTIDEYIAQLEQKGFVIRGNNPKIEEFLFSLNSGDFIGTYLTYPATVKLYATVLTRTVAKVHVDFYFKDDTPKEAQVDNIISLFAQKYGKTEYYNKGQGMIKPTIEGANMARWYLNEKPAIFMTFIGSKCQFDFGFEDNTLAEDEVAQKKKNQIEEQRQRIKSGIDCSTEF